MHFLPGWLTRQHKSWKTSDRTVSQDVTVNTDSVTLLETLRTLNILGS